MSVEIDGKIFRNIQEQVQKNKDDIEALSQGIRIVGYGETVPSDLQIGEAWLKGYEPPFILYVETADNGTVEVGQWPAKGPQGIQGDQGEPGKINNVSVDVKTLAAGMEATGSATNENGNISIHLEIPQGRKGIQGVQGAQGIQGPQGEKGEKGEQGNPAVPITIVGILSSVSNLPAPSTMNPSEAFLVGSSSPYTLYVVITPTGSPNYWFNAGAFEVNQITVDQSMDETSTNPVQNKSVTIALKEKLNAKGTELSFDNADARIGIFRYIDQDGQMLSQWQDVSGGSTNRASLDLFSNPNHLLFSVGGFFILVDNTDYQMAIGCNGSPVSNYDHWGTTWMLDEEGNAWREDPIHLKCPSSLTYAKMALFKRKDNATMNSSDLSWIKNHLKYIYLNDYVIGEGAPDATPSPKKTARFAHVSFDDVKFCLQNIAANAGTFTSLFDDPFFALLKDLHKRYGMVFSLYVYLADFLNVGAEYAEDFDMAKDWLKFGLHASSSSVLAPYEDATYSDAEDDYASFINHALSIGINTVGIDRLPRFDRYQLSAAAAEAFKNCYCGIVGALSPDDGRVFSYLAGGQQDYLVAHDKLFEEYLGLWFYSTDMRLDWFVPGFTSDYSYLVPVKSDPYYEFVYRYGSKIVDDRYDSFIVFTHEWQIYSSSYLIISGRDKLLMQIGDAILFAGYRFDYPMYHCDLKTGRSNALALQAPMLSQMEATFVQGSINNLGETDSSANRMRTDRFYLKSGSILKIKCASGWKAHVVSWDKKNSNSDFQEETVSFMTGTFSLNCGRRYYAVKVGKVSNEPITSNEGVEIFVGFGMFFG